jgi:hypothetical protein
MASMTTLEAPFEAANALVSSRPTSPQQPTVANNVCYQLCLSACYLTKERELVTLTETDNSSINISPRNWMSSF